LFDQQGDDDLAVDIGNGVEVDAEDGLAKTRTAASPPIPAMKPSKAVVQSRTKSSE
jgi:hypothetical protein